MSIDNLRSFIVWLRGSTLHIGLHQADYTRTGIQTETVCVKYTLKMYIQCINVKCIPIRV